MPSRLQVALSLLVLTGGLFLAILLALGCVVAWDPTEYAAAALGVPFFLFVYRRQYRGTFEPSAAAARKAGLALVVIAFLVGGTYLTINVETHNEHWFRAWPLPLLTAILFLAAVSDHRWARRLDLAKAEGMAPSGPVGTKAQRMAGGFTVLAVAAIAAVYVLSLRPPQFAEHVDAATARLPLPDGASDVSYCRSPRGTSAYEFTVTESAFREWITNRSANNAHDGQSKLQEVTQPVSLPSYGQFLPQRPAGIAEVTVTIGLHYESRTSPDAGFQAAFDRTTGRGYVYIHLN
jgi:hypothetical protein